MLNRAERIRVLVADDEPDFRRLLNEIFSRNGIELVAEAANADEATTLAELHRPDVAIVDLSMPGGGGIRAARLIRARSPRTRVVALTSSGERESVLEMMREGAVGYLVKGASFDDIIDAVERAAGGQATLSPAVTTNVVRELSGQLRREETRRIQLTAKTARIKGILQSRSLTMAYQPIVRLENGEPLAYEALARFNGTPRQTPDRWFADAAGVGLLTELEMAAMREAVVRLPDIGDGVRLSVNASPQTLIAPSFKHLVAPLDPGRLIIEITEHAAVENYEVLRSALARLREAGLMLAVDDTGAGFASLRHILNITPSLVKLDISIIQGIDADRAKRALVAAIVAFAGEIGAGVIAEGIETEAELETVRRLGVAWGQGFHIARPGPLLATV